jgi:hypothetical protein
MDREIVKAQFVLMVCTEAYYRRVMGQEKPGEGLRIGWEGTLIYNQIYRAASRNEKFIPIIFEKVHDIYIPTPLQGATRYFIPADYERLYNRLIGESPEKSPLGKRNPCHRGKSKQTSAECHRLGHVGPIWELLSHLANQACLGRKQRRLRHPSKARRPYHHGYRSGI